MEVHPTCKLIRHTSLKGVLRMILCRTTGGERGLSVSDRIVTVLIMNGIYHRDSKRDIGVNYITRCTDLSGAGAVVFSQLIVVDMMLGQLDVRDSSSALRTAGGVMV